MRTLAVAVFALASPVLAIDDAGAIAEAAATDDVAYAAPPGEVRVGGAIVGEELGGATGFVDIAPWLSAQASLGMGFVADAAV